MVARPWSSSRLSFGERLLLRCDGNAGIRSRPRRGSIPPLDLGGGKGAPLDVGGTLVLPLEGRQYVGELLALQKGCEEPFGSSRGKVNILETPQRKWASSRLEGRTSWIFSSCGRCSRLTTGTSGTRSGGLRKAHPHASCSGASRDTSPFDAGA